MAYLIDLRRGAGGEVNFFVVCGKINPLVICCTAASTFCVFLSELNTGSKIQLNITEPALGFYN